LETKEIFLTTEISGSPPKKRGRQKMNRTPDVEPQNTHLTAHGGIGLVIFHLARRRIEFALTPDRSPVGDIWISVDGHKYGIEVKTSRDSFKWQVKKSQIKTVDFYVLVAMRTAECFVLTSEEMASIFDHSPLLYGDVRMVERSSVNPATMNAWGRLDGKYAALESVPSTRRIAGSGTSLEGRARKVVHKKLADGTIKTYTYSRFHRSPVIWDPWIKEGKTEEST
jgi:hypothetical protein